MKTLSELMSSFVTAGSVRWIGIRPGRRADMISSDRIKITDSGLCGDRYKNPGNRAVTLLQYEHLAVIASLLGKDQINPQWFRRNIVVSGINLLALKNYSFQIGTAVLKGTGVCAPCSRMEVLLGPGGYTALRGHGGITARVVESGIVKIGDQVSSLPADG